MDAGDCPTNGCKDDDEYGNKMHGIKFQLNFLEVKIVALIIKMSKNASCAPSPIIAH